MADEETKTLKPTQSSKTNKPPEAEPEPNILAPTQEEDEGWRKFLWNEDTREFLGRTGKSWFLIFIFYVIFFISLFGFFMLNWYAVLSLTVSEDKPYKSGDALGSILFRDGPGLGIRPLHDRQTNTASSLIWFRAGAYENFRFWKNQLNSWFLNMPKWSPAVGGPFPPGTIDCSTSGTAASKSESCIVPVSRYGLCQPKDPDINAIKDFGYMRGEPCILIKLNRIYGWEPKGECTGGCLSSAPQELQDYIGANRGAVEEAVYLWCEGSYEHDKDNLGSIEYFPGPYIRKRYFPFLNQKNYQSPFLMMQLKRPLAGALIAIDCKVYNDSLDIDDHKKAKSIGFTRFQILID